MSFDQTELLEKSPLGIVISDNSQRVLWCNSQFLSDTHLDESEVVGKLYPSLPIEAIDKNAQIVQLFNENGNDDVKFQYWQNTLEQPEKAKIHYFTREREQQSKLSLAANKLGGSRLPKRASWVEFLDYEVSRSRRYNNPLSLLKLHLIVLEKPDNVIEETLHQTIKDTLMNELRWADMIGHTDHGTYLMVLPETPGEALNSLQEKLHKAMKVQIDFISKSIKYHIVFGEASWQKHDESQQMLMRARNNLVEKLEILLEKASQ
ncbi:GGDEF domain-containing protein [Aliikangiella coralliicola]|uniref:Diguanylate cyclase n=1 Tax=Aliikangiella coralliicola TaxID=2592383 RepID=A0A545UGC9_9GAMM|nr:PAS domain-containing protein [Aliikangiella coralliicola]TQV88530.1 hypothetical protein FLL46_08395 [Aliikangiella coralliicola]